MRRSYISPEYNSNVVNGTLNMLEESNFFSAKMLEIEEKLLIDNIDILWYQSQTKEQLDISIESTSAPYLYSPSEDKQQNLSLTINTAETPAGLQSKNTRWIFEINLKQILTNYLYAIFKKYRTFEGVKNSQTIYDDVDIAIINYINNNVLNRYRYNKIDLYLAYRSVGEENQLKYKNNWNINLAEETLIENYQTVLETDESIVKLLFLQLNSSEYIFDYYYNIHFERI